MRLCTGESAVGNTLFSYPRWIRRCATEARGLGYPQATVHARILAGGENYERGRRAMVPAIDFTLVQEAVPVCRAVLVHQNFDDKFTCFLHPSGVILW